VSSQEKRLGRKKGRVVVNTNAPHKSLYWQNSAEFCFDPQQRNPAVTRFAPLNLPRHPAVLPASSRPSGNTADLVDFAFPCGYPAIFDIGALKIGCYS
jgi:hypothetical protein